MSTILYENEKFLRIYQNLRLYDGGQGYAWVFGYPEGWQNSMDRYYQTFVDNLRVANIRAHNARYDDAKELEFSLLDFSQPVLPYPTTIQFYQSLRGLHYNLDNQDYDGCLKILDRLIDAVGFAIIRQLPQWEKADTW